MRMELDIVTDPAVTFYSEQIFYGATVTYVDDQGHAKTITTLGIDDADIKANFLGSFGKS
jgi:transcription elongation factor GreB